MITESESRLLLSKNPSFSLTYFVLSAAIIGGPMVLHLSDCDTDWDYLTAADFLIAAAGLRGGLDGSLVGGLGGD